MVSEEKIWKSIDWGDSCSRCGTSEVDVFTSALQENYAFDGDVVRCPDCGLAGTASVLDADDVWIEWGEYDEEAPNE